jgi:aspartyl-tRNA(Asn)/glutamyl-tRNA(Gln) amidotransferase subunit A
VLLPETPAAEDSAAVARLARAGMVLLGKTNTVEFAYGGVGINHHHGTPRNPWHAEPHVPGGSSSGSGVAVAAGLVPLALGTDTGGSVRIPAALCGVVGLKTTVGRVSRAGVFPLSGSFDSVGPLARSVEDAALALRALEGPDPRDEATLSAPPVADPLVALRAGVRGLRLAFPEAVFWEGVEPAIARAVRECGLVLAELGAEVSTIAFPEAEQALALNRTGLVVAAEAYAVHKERLERDFDRFDPIVAWRMRKGAEIAAADYIRSTQAWRALRVRVGETLRDVEALLVPATMIPAVPVAEADRDRETYGARNLAYLRNTAIGNILNLCGLSLPCGFARGLPIGLMVYGKPFQEDVVLRVGHAYERATEWHRSRPDLGWAEAIGR